MSQIEALQASVKDMTARIGKLTPRRREALELRSKGIPCSEAAQLMGIGVEGFKDLCKHAVRTLEVSTTTEAVALLSQAEALKYKAALMQARDAMVRRAPRHQVLSELERVL